eukprot:1199846-Amorphochlora_amoeboformis.AAC.1
MDIVLYLFIGATPPNAPVISVHPLYTPVYAISSHYAITTFGIHSKAEKILNSPNFSALEMNI